MWLALILAVLPGLAGAADTGECPVLSLDGPVAIGQMRGFIGAYVDPDWTKTAADMAGPDRDLFQPPTTESPDFGYTASKIWLRLCLRNDSQDTDAWRLYTRENFLQVYEVFVVRDDGRIDQPASLQPDSPFSARPVAYPELVVPLDIAVGETVTLFISYWSGGSSQMTFSIESKDSFDRIASSKTAKNFLFYGMMILLITVAMVSLAVFRHGVFLAYSAYSASALLYVMHGDGVAFQYLWPNWPLFNSNVTVFTGTAMIVFGALYARVFLKTRQRHPKIDVLLLVVMFGTLGLVAALYVPDTQLLKKLLIMVSLVGFLTCAISGVVSYLSGYREVRFYVIAWVSVVLAGAAMNLRHIFGVDVSQDSLHDAMRVVMVFDATMMGLGIADRYNQLRRSRQMALQDSLMAARRSLDLNTRLADLQAQYDLVTEMAKSRDHEIQNMVHDLRQPLHALRLNVLNLNAGHSTSPESAGQIETAFSYLENLIARQLESDPVEPDTAAVEFDDLGLQQVLGAIHEMFQPDAAAKGLDLRLVPSRHTVPIDALVLTRILSNLVSNAIKYTVDGGVLIGTRRRGDTLRIEVHDTGPGMTPAQFDKARQRTVRLGSGQGVPGNGLGLSIAITLAQRHGLSIELSGLRRSGTGLALVIGTGVADQGPAGECRS